MKRILRILGLIILFGFIAYASNWDLPPETQEDWELEHWEELQAYKGTRQIIAEEIKP